MKNTLLSLLVVLFVPIFALTVFHFAETSHENALRANLLASVRSATSLTEESRTKWTSLLSSVDFAEQCRGNSESDREFVAAVSLQEDCQQFLYWRVGNFLAVGLLAALVLYFLVLFGCVRMAHRSRHALIGAFRFGWYLSLVMAVVTVVVIGVLGTKSFFDFTVLLTNRYFPKLLLVFALGALVAIYQVVKTVLEKVPLEFQQNDAHSVTPAEAPALWARVKAIAEKVGTAPPTEILVGSELNFFVTELSVQHLGGKSSGRILYLSSRLMRILSVEEVESVIGHELGHFQGADTELSKQFYPFWRKTVLTQEALFSHAAAFPAAMLVRFFGDFFFSIKAKYSRQRELEADQAGAMVASPAAIARALVKMQLHSDAFMIAYAAAVQAGQASLPEDKEIFRAQLGNNELWSSVGTAQLAHPIDSHPPTADRLAALKCTVESLRREIEGQTLVSAMETWFSETADSIKKVEELHQQRVSEVMTFAAQRHLDTSTEEGRAQIEKTWPKVEWKVGRVRAFFFGTFFLSVVGAVLGALLGLFAGAKLNEFVGWIVGTLAVGSVLVFCWRHFQRLCRADFQLAHDGIFLGTWTRKIPFKEIAGLSAAVNNSICTMTVRLHQAAPHPSPYHWWKRPVWQFTVNLSLYEGDYNKRYATIYGYWEYFAAR